MYLCPQTSEQGFCCCGGTAVGTVQNHTHAGTVCDNAARQIGNIVLLGVGVFRNGTDCGAGLQCDLLRMIQNQCFDLRFDRVRQLITGSSKQFDTVEFHAVMRCGDHHAGICTVCPHQICNSRCGNNAQLYRFCSYRTNAGTKSRFQNI